MKHILLALLCVFSFTSKANANVEYTISGIAGSNSVAVKIYSDLFPVNALFGLRPTLLNSYCAGYLCDYGQGSLALECSNQCLLKGGLDSRPFFLFGPTLTYYPFYSFSKFGSVDNLNVAAVPEPATWATMIIGMAAVGCFARIRRRSTVSAV